MQSLQLMQGIFTMVFLKKEGMLLVELVYIYDFFFFFLLYIPINKEEYETR
jgi:hypothetical protein